jgi:hypothetical protein
VGVDHRRCNVIVPQEFLDSSNFVIRFQKMGGKAMAKCVDIIWANIYHGKD